MSARAARRKPFVAFCEQDLGLTLTPQQRVLAAVSIDGVQPRQLEGEEREIARVLFGEVDEVPPAVRRVLAWSLGRGSGKSTLAGALLVWAAYTADLGRVGPGMVPAAIAIAPRLATAKIDVGIARALVRSNPKLEIRVCEDDDTKEGFSIDRGRGKRVRIAGLAASRGGINTRGFDIVVLILDEAEFFFSDSDAAVTDRDSYNGAAPRLLHGPSNFALFISTPWPVPTLMGELFAQNWSAPTSALAACGSSLFMRDDDEQLAAEIEQERATDPENTARERDCDRDAVGASTFFDDATVRPCVVDFTLPSKVPPGEAVGVGADLALVRDSSTCAIVSRRSDGLVTLRNLLEFKPQRGMPLRLSAVVNAFAAASLDAGSNVIACDVHERQAAREHADGWGVRIAAPRDESAQGNFSRFEAFRQALRERRVQLPNHPRLLLQLRCVVVRPLPGGGWRIEQPRRVGQAHGDLVSALVLAAAQVHHDEADARRRARRVWVAPMPGKPEPVPPSPQQARVAARIARQGAEVAAPPLFSLLGVPKEDQPRTTLEWTERGDLVAHTAPDPDARSWFGTQRGVKRSW